MLPTGAEEDYSLSVYTPIPELYSSPNIPTLVCSPALHPLQNTIMHPNVNAMMQSIEARNCSCVSTFIIQTPLLDTRDHCLM